MDENRGHNEIQRSLGRIEGNIDSIRDDMKALLESSKSHDARIGAIEKSESYRRGISASIAAAVGFVAALATEFIKIRFIK